MSGPYSGTQPPPMVGAQRRRDHGVINSCELPRRIEVMTADSFASTHSSTVYAAADTCQAARPLTERERRLADDVVARLRSEIGPVQLRCIVPIRRLDRACPPKSQPLSRVSPSPFGNSTELPAGSSARASGSRSSICFQLNTARCRRSSSPDRPRRAENPERAKQIESFQRLAGGALVQRNEEVLPHGAEGGRPRR